VGFYGPFKQIAAALWPIRGSNGPFTTSSGQNIRISRNKGAVGPFWGLLFCLFCFGVKIIK